MSPSRMLADRPGGTEEDSCVLWAVAWRLHVVQNKELCFDIGAFPWFP
jgi:hypothetical protein